MLEDMNKPVICEAADYDGDGNRKHILIIDDDLDMLKILRFYLQDRYYVSIVNCGQVVMEFLSHYHTDLILLDYMMPQCNGAAVIKMIQEREDTRDIPVLFLTGKTDQDTVSECLSYHPAGYIVKPVAKQALLAKLDSLFH